MITIDDFKKLEIKIPEGDKLLKLIVDFGGEPNEQRQIMSGIAEYFPDPEVLVGQEMPFITNLEPRTLRGYESQGMILAADSEGTPVLLHPKTEVPSGSIVK
jgi:methionine--tRNA ligase beta chain